MNPPTEQEVEAVATVEWNNGVTTDMRPPWHKLKSPLDDALKKEFLDQARAGLMEFVRLRSKLEQQ